jgi:hypothetical protein
MADRKGLAIIGIILATVVGVAVVQWHVEERLSIHEGPPIRGEVTPEPPFPSAATKFRDAHDRQPGRHSLFCRDL